MPIIRSGNKVAYFSHIPKCAGSAIEAYIHKSGKAQLSFLDNRFLSHQPQTLWTKSSPQHVDGVSLARLFPSASFFDLFFAVIRNPYDRLKSAYKFQKYVERKITADVDFKKFVLSLDEGAINTIGLNDNHFLPQYRLFYPKAPYMVFKLEEGLEPVKKWLDLHLFGEEQPYEIGVVNDFSKRGIKVDEDLSWDPEMREVVSKLYKLDFELFGYETGL
ncbi:sulfotransferase family 2 domain-containing protein [Thalassospira sp.]|uniref:sulfotransferase family 2 domain-containing protein n=1 Tax=Thalassospira sp. TaxID=1912094 RepID=UPI000C660921|nr:sulfotransferase family 2 domain-containing protein [Thalassospira sp.]MBC08121.1 hypothetical protein [Thalassospira sp.]|tara:strand:- start:11449 stop:12102 length:654 start_codon:yes stop_codon:yes gene_type:complete